MGSHMKAKNKLEGATNLRVWKTSADLLLAKEDLLGIVKGKITEPEKDEDKSKFEKYDITTRSIIVDSVRDHLIPYITNLHFSKKMYDALTGL